MARRGGDNTVKMGFEFEGADEVAQKLGVIATAIERLNGGAGGSANGLSSTSGSTLTPPIPQPNTGLSGGGGSASIAPSAVSTGGVFGTGTIGSGTTALPAGQLAPNPFTGTGGATGGTSGGATVVQAGTVIIQGGNSSSSPSGSPMTAAPSSSPSPLPGWNPFSGGGQGGMFTDLLYGKLPGGIGGAFAEKGLQSGIGRQFLGGVASIEHLLPQGVAEGASSLLAGAAPYLGIAALAAGVGTSIYNTSLAYSTPFRQFDFGQQMAARSGAYVDPLMRARDREMAQLDSTVNGMNSFRGSAVGVALRFASLGIADAWHSNWEIRAQEQRQEIEADYTFDQRMRSLDLLTGQSAMTGELSSYDREIRASEAYDRLPWWKRNGRANFDPRLRGLSTEDVRKRRNNLVGDMQKTEMLAEAFGIDAFGNLSDLRSFDFAPYGSLPLQNVVSGIATQRSILNRPGYESFSRRLMDDPRSINSPDMLEAAAKELIFRGDTEGLAALSTQFRGVYGSDANRFLSSARQSALKTRESTTDDTKIQMDLSIAQSYIQTQRTTGAGYRDIAKATTGQAGLYDSLIANATERRAQTPEGSLERKRLDAEIAQLQAVRASLPAQAEQIIFQGRGVEIGTAQTRAESALQSALYTGSESDVVGAYGKQGAAMSRRANLLRDMSRSPFLSPEERAQKAAEAEQLDQQVKFGLAREVGGFQLGLRRGESGILSGYEAEAMSRAALFGGSGDIYRSRMNQAQGLAREFGLLQQEQAGAFGPRTQQEKLEIEQRLVEVQTRHAEAIEQATRSYMAAGVQVAQFAQQVVGQQQSRAMMMGAGGMEAFGYSQRSYEAAQETTRRAEARVAELRRRGVAEDNPEMQQAIAAAESAKTGEVSAMLSRSVQPAELSLRREQSQLGFAAQIYSMVPGGYAPMKGILQKQMGNYEREAQEIVERRDAQRRASGGKLSDMEEFQFEQQLQQVALQQAGTYRQLSYGWESQLTSQMLNTPGNFSFVMPRFSNRAAIMNGVQNPHLGSNEADLPFFLNEAGLAASAAGAGGPGYAGLTALSGGGLGGNATGTIAAQIGSEVAKALQGLQIPVTITMPDGSRRQTMATVANRSQGPGVELQEYHARQGSTAPKK